MRRFKIKNRQKRKYTRRHATIIHFSASRSIMVGIIPSVLLAIALMATVVIQYQPTNLPASPVNLPSLLSQSLSQAIQYITSTFHNTSISFSLPAIKINLPHLTLPKIALKPIILPSRPIQPLNSLGQSISAFAGLAFREILTFALWLNPRPALLVIGQLSTTFFSLFIQASAIVLSTIGYICLVGLALFFQGASATIQALLTATLSFIHMIFFVGTVALIVGIEVVRSIFFLFEAIFNGVISVLHTIINGIVWTGKAILNLITLPFRVMGGYLQQLKPYFDFFGVHVKFSISELGNSFGNLFGGFAQLVSSHR